jgi:hypothetical protein
MRYLRIGEKIRKTDEVNIQPFTGEPWTPIWKRVTGFIGWYVTESTYGKYRRTQL